MGLLYLSIFSIFVLLLIDHANIFAISSPKNWRFSSYGALPQADLELKMIVKSISYETKKAKIAVELTNNGPDTTTDITINCSLHKNLNTVQFSTKTGYYDPTSGRWSITNISAEEKAVLDLTLQITDLGIADFRTEVVHSTSQDPDSVPGNSDISEDDEDTVTLEALYLRGIAKFGFHAPLNLVWDEEQYNITEADVENMKNLLNPAVVRVDLCYTDAFPSKDVSQPNGSYFQLLDDYIGWCGKRGIYVILDMHSYNPYMQMEPNFFSDSNHLNQIRDAWVFLAKTYADNLTIIGADLFNEPWNLTPYDEPDPQTWKLIAEDWIDAMQPISPTWLFFVEGVDRIEWGNNNFNWIKTYGIERTNVVYSPHLYWGIPGQWTTPWAELYAQDRRQEGKEEMLQWIIDRWPLDGSHAFFVGEFGGYSDEASLAILEDVLDFFNQTGIQYSYWCWHGASYPARTAVDNTWSQLTNQGQILRQNLIEARYKEGKMMYVIIVKGINSLSRAKYP